MARTKYEENKNQKINKIRYKHHEDMIGQRFYKLVVLSHLPDKQDAKHRFVFECQCDCGNRCQVTGSSLRCGRKSCGCLLSKTTYVSKHIIRVWFTQQKLGAKRGSRNFEFSITPEYLDTVWEKQNGKCALSNTQITLPKNSKEQSDHKYTASLDRIDSKKGYIEGNVQFIHKSLNRMKWNMSEPLFIEWCHTISDYHRGLT